MIPAPQVLSPERPQPWMRWAMPLGLAIGLAWLAQSIDACLQQRHANDIKRRWVVWQYVLQGVNPYPLALAALHHAHGTVPEARAANVDIWKIPPYSAATLRAQQAALAGNEACRLLDAYGPPEAVYPPSHDFFLAPVLGNWPRAWITPGWLLINLALGAACCWLLTQDLERTTARSGLALAVCTGFLLWAPVHTSIFAGQYALPALACLLMAVRLLETRPAVAGLFLAVGLIKPSLTLPFLILPLVRRRWSALGIPLAIHGAATLAAAAAWGVPPWTLLAQWYEAGSYFATSMYTLQEYLHTLRLDQNFLGSAITFGFLGSVAAWCWWNRRADLSAHFDFLCLVSIFWTYHAPYDFVLLFLPLARATLAPATGWRRIGMLVGAGSLLVLSLATAPWIYTDNDPTSPLRWLRWGARGLLMLWTIGLAVQLWRRARGPHGATTPYVVELTRVKIADADLWQRRTAVLAMESRSAHDQRS